MVAARSRAWRVDADGNERIQTFSHTEDEIVLRHISLFPEYSENICISKSLRK